MNKGEGKESYFSFLLRMWEVDGEGVPTWRASLEDPRTGERMGFASLESLFVFLWQQAGVISNQAKVKVIEQRSIRVVRTLEPKSEAQRDMVNGSEGGPDEQVTT